MCYCVMHVLIFYLEVKGSALFVDSVRFCVINWLFLYIDISDIIPFTLTPAD